VNTSIKLRGLACAVAAGWLAACPSATEDRTGAAAATDTIIVDLEARFADASRERGAKAAFLEFLGEESIVLRPGPTWGRAAWTVAEDLPGTLDWLPDRAQVAADGELGFSTGPWSFTPNDPKRGASEGRYVTVWRRTDNGWRVLFDGGFGRKPAGAWEARGKEPVLRPYACERSDAAPPGELQLLDLAISGIPGAATHAERMQPWMDEATTLFHDPSVEGARDAAARTAALASLPATSQYWPMGADIASSGDLGYSYGLAAPAPGASADTSYVHIWCRHGSGWRLALQLRSKLPAG
jgi:ketosteroid isomerase-like protein